MSQILKPWIFNTRLFYTFFTEHRTALKELAAALVGVPKERVLALEELGMWRAALGVRLILDNTLPVSIYLLPALSNAVSFHSPFRDLKPSGYSPLSPASRPCPSESRFSSICSSTPCSPSFCSNAPGYPSFCSSTPRSSVCSTVPGSPSFCSSTPGSPSFCSSTPRSPSSCSSNPYSPSFRSITPGSPSSCSSNLRFPPLFSSAHDFRPLLTPADFQATTPFLLIFLVYENPEQENPFFYMEVLPTDSLSSARILNLAALPPAGKGRSSLYAFSRLLTVSRSTELPPLCSRFPCLKSAASLLEKELKERELTDIFSEHGPFSPAGSRGISAMCSLNRLLLRENRLSDLKKISQDPEALKKVFQEFQKKGFL